MKQTHHLAYRCLCLLTSEWIGQQCVRLWERHIKLCRVFYILIISTHQPQKQNGLLFADNLFKKFGTFQNVQVKTLIRWISALYKLNNLHWINCINFAFLFRDNKWKAHRHSSTYKFWIILFNYNRSHSTDNFYSHLFVHSSHFSPKTTHMYRSRHIVSHWIELHSIFATRCNMGSACSQAVARVLQRRLASHHIASECNVLWTSLEWMIVEQLTKNPSQ